MSNKENNKNENLEQEFNEEINNEELEIKNEDEIEEVDNEEILEDEASKLNKLEEELFKFKNENTKLSNELDAYKDRLLRITAEYDNYRKRTKEEKERIYTDACEDVLKEMFPVLDNLERAVSVEGSVDDLKKGIEMTIRQFQTAFEKLGVEEIDASKEFDPNVHQAVMHIQDESLDANSITEVFQKGYKKGDKVLRFTMVKVAN